ncbi:MAG: hypothetical protein ABI821_06535 [Pseudomonadota bacterium]
MNAISAAAISAASPDKGAVSWGAVFAGAVGAAALSLILILLGTGLGLSAVSPWAHEGISGVTASVSTVLWVTFVQLAASVLGGYLAGRLRSRWVSVHTNEVYFRDTAHGFLAWSVATLLMASLLSSAVGSMLSTGLKAGGTVVASAATVAGAGAAAGAASADKGDTSANPLGYYVDVLFRDAPAGTAANSAPQSAADNTAEVTRIFANGLKNGELGAADTQYLGQLVAANTGLSQTDAENRVTETFSNLKQTLQQAADKAKKAADDARKASAYLSIWLVVSLLIGAFVASLAATFGGRLRDSSVLANY